MADKNQCLIITQFEDGSWTISMVANEEQGKRRARNMASEPMIEQCVAVPIQLAALAPKMKDMLAGHADIDAMMVQVETGEVKVSAPGACELCGVPHSPEGLVKCSSCLKHMCPGCTSRAGDAGAELCEDCAELLRDASAQLEASGEVAPQNAEDSGPADATPAE
jgi:hypothetical protein